jgi:hypothetical protein
MLGQMGLSTTERAFRRRAYRRITRRSSPRSRRLGRTTKSTAGCVGGGSTSSAPSRQIRRRVSIHTVGRQAPLRKLAARRNSSPQPRYRRLANIEATRQVGLAGATVGKRVQSLALLMNGKLWWSTHMNPTRLGASSTFPGSGTDQFTFKLGEAAKNREHQSAMWRGRVCPNVGQ